MSEKKSEKVITLYKEPSPPLVKPEGVTLRSLVRAENWLNSRLGFMSNELIIDLAIELDRAEDAKRKRFYRGLNKRWERDI